MVDEWSLDRADYAMHSMRRTKATLIYRRTKNLLGVQLLPGIALGLMLKTGTVVDATLTSAASSTKNQAGERDPEMKQSKKGNQWHFGMKAHIGVDAESGLVHTVVGTSGTSTTSLPRTACCTARRARSSPARATVASGSLQFGNVAVRPSIVHLFRLSLAQSRRSGDRMTIMSYRTPVLRLGGFQRSTGLC